MMLWCAGRTHDTIGHGSARTRTHTHTHKARTHAHTQEHNNEPTKQHRVQSAASRALHHITSHHQDKGDLTTLSLPHSGACALTGRLGHYVPPQLHYDPSSGLPANGHIEVALGFAHRGQEPSSNCSDTWRATSKDEGHVMGKEHAQ